MASTAPTGRLPVLWSRRLTEWCLLAAILLGVFWVFEREIQKLQGQSERVLVWSTLASLRTALVIQQLQRQVHPQPHQQQVKNPFLLLDHVPPNFAGELRMRDIDTVPPGSWVFDPTCPCIGYRLLYPQWLEPARETGTIWLRIELGTGSAKLTPLEVYRWFGQPVR